MQRHLFILFSFSFLLISACYQDEVYIDETTIITVDHPEEEVTGIVVGILTDENGEILKDLEYSHGEEVKEVGSNGLFYSSFKDGINQGTALTFSKNDFNFSKITPFVNDNINYSRVTIFSEELKSTNLLDIPLIVDVNNEISLDFQKFPKLETGEEYTDEVIMKEVIPDLQQVSHLHALPGRIAKDSSGLDLILDFDQVYYLELLSSNHKNLHFDDGLNLKWKNVKGDTQNLWFFDVNLSKWIDIGSKISSNNLEAKIEGSGFYALAKSAPFNMLKGQVMISSFPLQNHPIEIFENDRLILHTLTTNKGTFLDYLPIEKNYTLKVQLENQEYAMDFFMEERGVELPTIILDIEKHPVLNIKGNVLECNEEANEGSFTLLSHDNVDRFYFSEKEENELWIPGLGAQHILLQHANESLDEFSPEIKYEVNDLKLDFNRSYTCNAYNEGYFIVKIDEGERAFTVMESRLNEGRTQFLIYDEINLVSGMTISFSGNEARNYQDNELNILFDQVVIDGNTYEIRCENNEEGCGFDSFEILHYGQEKGGWIQGQFSGEFWVKTYSPTAVSYKKISGTFMVPRTFS